MSKSRNKPLRREERISLRQHLLSKGKKIAQQRKEEKRTHKAKVPLRPVYKRKEKAIRTETGQEPREQETHTDSHCYGATQQQAKAFDQAMARQAGLQDSRRKAVLPPAPFKKEKPKEEKHQPKVTPPAEEKKQEIVTALPHEGKKKNVTGTILSVIVIVFAFLIPLYMVHEVWTGRNHWPEQKQGQEQEPEIIPVRQPIPPLVVQQLPREEAKPSIVTGSYRNLALEATCSETQATIESAIAITKEEADGFLTYLAERYPTETALCSFHYDETGKMTITYPASGEQIRKNALEKVWDALDEYLRPINGTYDHYGVTLQAQCYETNATIQASGNVTESDAVGFIAYLTPFYPTETNACTITYQGNKAVITYPATNKQDRVKTLGILSLLLDDYLKPKEQQKETEEKQSTHPIVTLPQPIQGTYDNYGIRLQAQCYETNATILASDNVTESDAEGFIAYLVTLYPNETNACTVTYRGNTANVTYPTTSNTYREKALNTLSLLLDDYLKPKEQLKETEEKQSTHPIVTLPQPIKGTYDNYGIRLQAQCFETNATVMASDNVTESDAEGFTAYLTTLYPAETNTCTIAYQGNTATATYPATSETYRTKALKTLVLILDDYLKPKEQQKETEEKQSTHLIVTLPQPIQGTYDNYGIRLQAQCFETNATVMASDNVTRKDAEGFIAYLTTLRPTETNACTIAYQGNTATVTYPATSETYRKEALKYLSIAMDDYLKPKETEPVRKVTEQKVETKKETILPQTTKEKKSWHKARFGFEVSGVPYSFSYVDFFNARKAIRNAGVSLWEFTSRYGFEASGAFFVNVGGFRFTLSAGYHAFTLNRSILASTVQYRQVPVLLKVSYQFDFGMLNLGVGLIGGADFASLTTVSHVYPMFGLDIDLGVRFSEHFEAFFAVGARMTLQLVNDDPLYSSITYSLLPKIGLRYLF